MSKNILTFLHNWNCVTLVFLWIVVARIFATLVNFTNILFAQLRPFPCANQKFNLYSKHKMHRAKLLYEKAARKILVKLTPVSAMAIHFLHFLYFSDLPPSDILFPKISVFKYKVYVEQKLLSYC
jgi:hypothetical protein